MHLYIESSLITFLSDSICVRTKDQPTHSMTRLCSKTPWFLPRLTFILSSECAQVIPLPREILATTQNKHENMIWQHIILNKTNPEDSVFSLNAWASTDNFQQWSTFALRLSRWDSNHSFCAFSVISSTCAFHSILYGSQCLCKWLTILANGPHLLQ